MSVLSAFLIFCSIGVLESRHPDIDINRVRYLPNEEFQSGDPFYNPHERRSIEISQFLRSNDYDDHSSGLNKQRAPLHIVYGAATTTATKIPLKIHQSREDPRLFYQSDAYLQEINGQNINHEVTKIYPGREVVRGGEESILRSLPVRLEDREQNWGHNNDLNICVRCPHDRTIIAKTGSDRVVLQHPRLVACSGRKAPRNVRFVHMYGPKFGNLLEQGSHAVVGRIMHMSNTLQLCKMQVHVVVQTCPTPKYLEAHCEDRNKPCNFSCLDPKTELHGNPALLCGNDMKWKGVIPTCRARTWCEPPPPPDHGRVSCQGQTSTDSGLVEGSRCRVQCARGWRWSPRAITVCRRGAWTHKLNCQPKRNTVSRG